MNQIIEIGIGALLAIGPMALFFVFAVKRTVDAHNDRLENHWNTICDLRGRLARTELNVDILSNRDKEVDEEDDETEESEPIPPEIQAEVTKVMVEHGLIPG